MHLQDRASLIRSASDRILKEAPAVCALWLASAVAASAQTVTVLHSFDGTDGADPQNVTLAQGRDGNLYGTTSLGGLEDGGTVFRIAPSGSFSTIYKFSCAEGCEPLVAPVLGPNGLFYGTAPSGGSLDIGTAFSLSANGTFTLLVNFEGSNGASPNALVLGTDGNYYGTTAYGGTDFPGTVFKMSPSGVVTVLHSFSNGMDGAFPGNAALTESPDGAFYGVTAEGGSFDDGVVFVVTRSGEYKILYTFDGTHGFDPWGTLLLASDGNFYGTTSYGGLSNFGTVFKMTPVGTLNVLHSFSGPDGEHPTAGLIQATDGKLYGTAIQGGTSDACPEGCGTIFSITTAGSFNVLYNFDGLAGGYPAGMLTQHTDGALYGTAVTDGAFGGGTVYRLNLGLGPFVKFLINSGTVGSRVQIFGQELTGTTAVSFNGTRATSFKALSNTFLEAAVPAGATSGPVVVTTPCGRLTSNVRFYVVP
jgi:uncharacterized repeat protein (TIGR03803 family)